MSHARFVLIGALLACLGLLCGGAPARAQQDFPVLSFGIVPQQSAAKLASTWGPVLAAISEKARVRLEFRTAPDIPAFEQRLAAGEYDIAYMNPYHYTEFSKRVGYGAIAKEKDRKIQGIIVVKKDSPIQSIAQLRGQVLAFPAPAAFAASVLPRAALRKQGISFQTKYVSSHDSVYFAVAEGLFAAGGGIVRTLESVDQRTQDALRILWRTEQYTPHAIAARANLSAPLIGRLVEAMDALDDTEDGRKLLTGIGFKGIEPAQDSDWDDVRALGIQALDTQGD